MLLAYGVFPWFVQEKAAAPANPICPMQVEHASSVKDRRHEGVVERGDKMMGFAHKKTTHHFRAYADGGSIEAEANDSEDAASRDQIRSHLAHITTLFAAGNFSAPVFIHQQNPPGTEAMKRLRHEIQYKLELTKKGARIRIRTKDPEALRAVHEFLRFQISDHQTGDSPDVGKLP